jgi:hypothetical protein
VIGIRDSYHKCRYTHSGNVFFCWNNILLILKGNTVRYATTNSDTTNECYNGQFLYIKSGCYNEHRCYNERGGILPVDVERACARSVGLSRID